MATTSSTPTKPALLQELDRRGVKVSTTNADWVTLFRFKPDKIGAAYLLNVDIVGTRLLTAKATLPCAYALSRRALFMTDASGVVSLQTAVETIGTDRTTDANITLIVSTDGTYINALLSAEYPTNWNVNAQIVGVDQFQVG